MAASEHPSDDDLIAGIAGGDREAFAALYRRRRPDVYRFALHVSGSPEVADDVSQDVFVAVINHAGRYRSGRSGVVPWLLGIARNHVRRWVAHERTAVSLANDDEEPSAARTPTVDTDPLANLSRRRDVAALRRAVLALPVKYREAVVLCDLHELSYAGAAAALGCAIGTVRSRLHRGRAMLAKRLRGSDEAAFRNAAARWIL
ncbi:MAG: RNA polymerase subunit sigma-70 [Acidobacteria bacterium]|nr:MAG: RNA polymerase subunit sigma-70 [Acidobacteriota bacterium]